MLRMKLNDGTSFTVTGSDAKKAVGSLEKVIYDHDKISRTHRLVKAIKKDTSLLVRAAQSDGLVEAERVTIGGVRLRQFNRAVELIRANRGWTIYRACSQALREIAGDGGYPTVDSLHRFCLAHPRTCLG